MQTDTFIRVEIVERVGTAFADRKGADRNEILVAATDGHARLETIDLLRTLPDRRFGRVNDPWEGTMPRTRRPGTTYRSVAVAGNRSP